MTTIANVIDRIYRDYLSPPGEQFSRFVVGTGGITSSATTLPFDWTMLSPEEQDAIGPGALLESGSELMLVTAVDTSGDPDEATVRRGMFGTPAAAHAAGDFLYVAGDGYTPRYSAFTAVCDAIEALWPDLWTVAVEETWSDVAPIELPAACREVFDIRALHGSRWVRAGSWDELQDFPESSTGVAVQVRGVSSGCSLQIYYRSAPSRPDDESDDISDLGVEEGWVKVLCVMATAEVIANEDVDRTTIDFITDALAAEGFQVGQGADIRNALIQYADYLMRPLKRSLKVRQRGRVVIDRGF